MLLQKIDSTIDVITRSLDLADLKSNHKRVQNLTRTLQEIYNLEIEVSILQKEFEKRGTDIELQMNLKGSRIKLKQLYDSVQSGTIPTEREILTIKSELSQALADLNLKWQELVKEKISPIIDLLNILKGVVSNDQEVTFIINNLNNLQKDRPKVKSFEVLDQWILKGQDVISQLHLNPDIIGFLRKVYASNADAADLTPEVLNWLRDNELLHSLKLSFERK